MARPLAERTIALSGEYGFPQWLCAGHLLRGWACVEIGEARNGLDDVRTSVRGMESTGSLVFVQFGNYQLARVLSKIGQTAEALGLVDRILAEIRLTTGCWFESEVHRLRGDLLQETGAPTREVEACYEAAIATALRQGARLWQLRATNALGSLWRAQGRNTTELYGRLAPLCADFAVSTTNPDLERGKALLTSITFNTTH
jgi:predicted ATPase